MSTIWERLVLSIPENIRLERIWFIAKTDFKKRYYGSFLGLFWALLNPIFKLVIYYTVFTVVFQSQQEYFAMFLYIGLTHFLFFNEVITGAMKIYQRSGYLLENIQVSDLDIYFAKVLTSFYGLLFNLGIFLLFRPLFVDEGLSIYALFYPLVLATLLILVFAGALIMSMLWVFFRDVQHLWDLFKLALMWLSGVFYLIEPATTWKTMLMAYSTPIPGILINARATLLYNELPDMQLLGYDFLYASALLGIGLLVHSRFNKLALEKL